MTWTGVWEAARGLYSLALVASLLTLAAVIARFAPLAFRVLTGLSEALTLAAQALRGATVSADALARVETKVDEIHRATVRQERNPP